MGQLARQLWWQWRGVAIATPSVALLVILLRALGLLQAWEWSAYDQFLRIRPARAPDPRIAIVGLDEQDLMDIGQPIVPDQIYADLITTLQQQSPRAIGLDIYRDLPVEPGHAALVEVFESTPNLVGIQKVIGERGRETVPAPPALKSLGQVGSNDIVVDADTIVRRGLISVDDANGETVYSLPLYLALLYLADEGIGPQMVDDSDSFWLGEALFHALEPNDGSYVRADTGGYQQLLDPLGPVGTIETVSVSDVLNNTLPEDWATDRIILIGAVGESFHDFVYTAHSSGLLSLPKAIPGVELHAQFTSQIVAAALGERSLPQVWPDWLEHLWILGWATLGATLAWQLRKTRSSPIRTTLILTGGAIASLTLLIGSTYSAIVAGWWIPVVPAAIALVGSGIAVVLHIAQTASGLRKTFGRYLGDEIVDTLLESPEGLKMGGERRHITILTSDVRGFTALSEQLAPEEVIKILNFYLEHMAEVITSYGGIIDDFIGDGILVVFGAPTAYPNHAERAVACAIAMQLAMQEVNQTIEAWGFAPLEMGIGINTGDAVVGNMGSTKRTKYSVIGSQVNLAFRIETYTTGGQILISEQTLKAVGQEHLTLLSQTEVMPKGVQNPVQIHEVGGISGEYHLQLQQMDETFLPLGQPLAITYVGLSGKHMSDQQFAGKIIQLSAHGALVQGHSANPEAILPPLTNLKLNFLAETGVETTDIYAKILAKSTDEGQFYVRFTAKVPAVEKSLTDLYASLQRQSRDAAPDS